MNEKIKGIMTEAGISVEYVTNTKQIVILEKFAELIIQECIACCGSQADMRNIRNRFGLPTESNVKYLGPEAQGHHSQYGREYNIPK
jgi:hypothetical protein